MVESPIRTLTIGTNEGLGNRLRVLLSGMALAEATARYFTMLWPCTNACAASYSELFATPWNVLDATDTETDILRQTAICERITSDLLTSDAVDLQIWTCHSLVMPQRFTAHKQLSERMAELLAAMQPADGIMARVETFQTDVFRSRMIGVHLRRGDLQLSDPAVTANTLTAIRAVDAYLASNADAGIFLCTDDGAPDHYTGKSLPAEGVRSKFVQRYGERVVFTIPRSLDRRDPVAIQDAIVDMWLLRRTDCLVGTVGSSFSNLAALGRSVPVTMCASQHPLRHLIPMTYWLKGERPLKWLARYCWRLIRPRVVKRNSH